jgi:hypothetical protein
MIFLGKMETAGGITLEKAKQIKQVLPDQIERKTMLIINDKSVCSICGAYYQSNGYCSNGHLSEGKKMRAKITLFEKIMMVFHKFRFKKLSALKIAKEIEKLPDWRQK